MVRTMWAPCCFSRKKKVGSKKSTCEKWSSQEEEMITRELANKR